MFFEKKLYVITLSSKFILYAKDKLIKDFFIRIRFFLNFETNVSYIDNVLIDKLNYNFVESIDLINVQLADKFHMSNDKQICCNLPMIIYNENTVIHTFDFFDFDMMLKYE